MRQAGLQLVRTKRVLVTLGLGFSLSAVASSDLGHRFDIGGVEFVQAVDVFEDRVEVLEEASGLGLGEFEVGEIGDVLNVFLGNLDRKSVV